jgi:hypothetical protein
MLFFRLSVVLPVGGVLGAVSGLGYGFRKGQLPHGWACVKARYAVAGVGRRPGTPWLCLGEGQVRHCWGWVKARYAVAGVG